MWCERNISKGLEFLVINRNRMASVEFRIARNRFIKSKSHHKLLLIRNEHNYGFAEANNIAIRLILKEKLSKYILLLNNDTEVDSYFLNKLVEGIESNKHAAIAGPKIYYYNYENKKDVIWFGGGIIDWRRYPGYFHINYNKQDLPEQENKSTISKTDWISGACMLINITKIKLYKNNVLAKDYYLGGEDIDLCIRVKNDGLEVIYVPSAYIWHKVGRSRPFSLKQAWRSTLTNLKLNKKHNKYFFLFLPIYTFTIPIRYFKLIINKFKSSSAM